MHKREQDIWFQLTEYNLFKGQLKWVKTDGDRAEIANQIVEDVILPKGVTNLSVDSLYNSLNSQQKNKVIDFAINYGTSSSSYMQNTSEEMAGYARWITRHEIEWHRKFVLSIACLLFYLIGAPLGAIIRKGGFGLPVIISVFIFLIYYIISITFEKTVREMVLIPEIGMWISTAILVPISFLLIFKTANDSMRISAEFYSRIINLFKRKSKKS